MPATKRGDGAQLASIGDFKQADRSRLSNGDISFARTGTIQIVLDRPVALSLALQRLY